MHGSLTFKIFNGDSGIEICQERQVAVSFGYSSWRKKIFRESTFASAIRELYEETGLEITDDAEIDNVIDYYDS